MRTARRLGIPTVAVYSDADRGPPRARRRRGRPPRPAARQGELPQRLRHRRRRAPHRRQGSARPPLLPPTLSPIQPHLSVR